MTQAWRTLVLLYPVLDARYGSGLQRTTARRVMTRDERAAVMDVVERLPATVRAWSDDLATLEPFDVVEVRRSVRSLSSSGAGRWWVGPREVRPELEAVADTGATYDSVYALWPCEASVPQCGWGCSIGPSESTFGAGFSSISTDHWRTLLTDPDPEQGYVHEWLHQVESVYRALGVSESELPPLHDAASFTSARPVDEPPYGRSYAEFHDGGARTWVPWYRDWMTGRLTPVEGAAAPDRLMGDSPDRTHARPMGSAKSKLGGRVPTVSPQFSLDLYKFHLYYRLVHAFDVLGDPVRRRILELLAEGESTSGRIAAVVQAEFGISQPAVSQHLKVLRDSGFATVRPEGTRRLYAVNSAPLHEVDAWLDPFRRFWEQRLDSLATELARGKRERRLAAAKSNPSKEDPK